MLSFTPLEILEAWTHHCQDVRQDQISALINRARIPVAALTGDPGEYGFAIRAAAIEQQKGGRFEFAEHEGEPALIVPARDWWGEVADLIAFRPGANGFAASWLGAAVLGLQNVPRRLDDPLQIHQTATDWLRSGRQGVVLVDPERGAREVRDYGPFRAASVEQGLALRNLMIGREPSIVVPPPDDTAEAAA